MAQGYKLVSRIKRASADYVPSLIGIHRSRDFPSPEDQYFELIDLVGYRPGCIDTIERTNMVAYDSLPLEERDPIIKAYGSGMSFHTTVSDAYRLAEEEGDELLRKLLDTLTGKKRD